MAGRKLTANVVVLDEAQSPVLLNAGQEVPAEYADQVGDHCFAVQGEAEGDDEAKQPAKKAAPRKSS